MHTHHLPSRANASKILIGLLAPNLPPCLLGIHLYLLDLSEHLNILSFFFGLFRDAPMAHGSSQAMGQTGAVAAGLHHSHSNARSEPCLRPTPELTTGIPAISFISCIPMLCYLGS